VTVTYLPQNVEMMRYFLFSFTEVYMQVLIENGIAFIIAFQSLAGSWLIAPMQFFSFLGNEEFFLLILPLIY